MLSLYGTGCYLLWHIDCILMDMIKNLKIFLLVLFGLFQSVYASNNSDLITDDKNELSDFHLSCITSKLSSTTTQMVLNVQLSDYSGFSISSIGMCDGSIDITIFGGILPYSYVWSTGDTTEDLCSLEEGAYTVWVFDANNDFITQSFVLESPDEQTVNMPTGWSIMSTYLNPTLLSVTDVFSSILSNLIIVKDEYGNFYWPQYGVNYIGNLIQAEGYFVNMTTNDSVLLIGSIIPPETTSIEVPLGWSLIGYIRTTIAPINLMLTSITNEIEIVKDSEGQIYWPQLNVNNIINMIPGEGYQVKMYSTQYLTYPANLESPIIRNCPYHAIDYDRNVYTVAQIGDQCWMGENLKTTHYSDGSSLVNGAGLGDINGNYTTKYCFDYNDDVLNIDTYGKLYTWAAMMNGTSGNSTLPTQGVCPIGWHVPKTIDWNELQGVADTQYSVNDSEWLNSGYLGSDAGGNLKEDGNSHWNNPNAGGTNSSGFRALPAGYRMTTGSYLYQGDNAFFWADEEQYTYHSWFRKLGYNNNMVFSGFYNKTNAFSVRCIQD